MNRVIKTGLIMLCLSFCWAHSSFAAEVGLNLGMMADYTGNFEELDTDAEREIQFGSDLEDAAMPVYLFLIYNRIKLGYLHYEQYSAKAYPSSASANSMLVDNDKGTVLIRNDVFTVGYQHDLPLAVFSLNPFFSTMSIYGSGSLAFFKSTMNVEISKYGSVGRSEPGSYSANLKSEPQLSMGFILSFGLKKMIDNIFVGCDLTYINKTINYERIPSLADQVKVDIGGFIYSITAGVVF